MDLLTYHKISDLYKTLNLPLEQELDFAIHFLPDLHKKLPFKSPLFRADYFSFVFVKDGAGNYTIDDVVFPFKANTIYFTNPGHIKAFAIEESRDAHILTFTESFLRENVHPEVFEEFPFLLAETVPPKILAPIEFQEFENLYRQINSEFHKDTKYKRRILGSLVVVLLLKIKETFWSDYNPIDEGDRSSQIVSRFKLLLETEFKKVMSGEEVDTAFQVQEYARQMHLHPNYLNAVIKSKTGKPVNEWISNRMLSAAKSLLQNSDVSLKEIAFRLGFSEATHFSRFFKKHTYQSPGAYRKSIIG